MLIFGFKHGDTELFHWDEDNQMLYLVSSEKMNEHDDDLLIVDTHYDKGLILTVCR